MSRINPPSRYGRVPFLLRRLGCIMEPDPARPEEAEGVLNPACARGRDGELYLFPRVVAKGNYSRIAICRVRFNRYGNPAGVERLGMALEPEAEYELRPPNGGGCEDPRITFIPTLDLYAMTYTAYGKDGPRIALACSRDLMTWERRGLVRFEPEGDVDLNHVFNKDAVLFPEPVLNRDGRRCFAIIHRPLFPGTRPEGLQQDSGPRRINVRRESLWISYRALSSGAPTMEDLNHFRAHRRVASPVNSWERLKVGGGAPPLMTKHGWLLIYHGVRGAIGVDGTRRKISYSAGVMVLDRHDPHSVLYRGRDPILYPGVPEERTGIVANVVFPTGVDQRQDLGKPRRIDVYYGMADDRVGVATMNVPARLPREATADPHAETV